MYFVVRARIIVVKKYTFAVSSRDELLVGDDYRNMLGVYIMFNILLQSQSECKNQLSSY